MTTLAPVLPAEGEALTFSGMLDEILAHIAQWEAPFLKALESANTLDAVQTLRQNALGRKGWLALSKRNLKDVSPEQRGPVGQALNVLSQTLEQALDAKQAAFETAALDAQLAQERVDVTLPGWALQQGHAHPLVAITERVLTIFEHMGFTVLDDNHCPEVETDYYNFDALNFPTDHPAKEMQDTFYTNRGKAEGVGVLLRSQTSNAQIRYMEGKQPPFAIVAPGRVYRNEDVSSKKHVLFHQLEGLVVDKAITIAHLKGTLAHFIRSLFGTNCPVRFRTSYFPFTEPSMEMDVLYRRPDPVTVAMREDWLEIMGCGMVDPNVLQNVGIDPTQYSGFAFGMGIERLAMLCYNIHNIRDFYTNDLRQWRAFNG